MGLLLDVGLLVDSGPSVLGGLFAALSNGLLVGIGPILQSAFFAALGMGLRVGIGPGLLASLHRGLLAGASLLARLDGGLRMGLFVDTGLLARLLRRPDMAKTISAGATGGFAIFLAYVLAFAITDGVTR